MNFQLKTYTNDSFNPSSKSLLFSWTKQNLDTSQLKNHKSLRILIDRSGSMTTPINGNYKKCDIVAESVINCAKFLNNLYHDDIHIHIGLFFFNNECICVIPYKIIDDNMLTIIQQNIYKWCDPKCNTDFRVALEESHNLMQKYTSEYETILISDGYNNGAYRDEELIEIYGNTINISIGIGSVESYNNNLFKKLTILENVYGANNGSELHEYFINSIFGITTKVAENIKFILPNVNIISPLQIKNHNNSCIIELDNYHSHRIFMIYCESYNDLNIKVTYKLVKTGEYKIENFYTHAFINDKIDMKIKLYCQISHKLIKGYLNQEKIKKLYNNIDQLVLHDNIIDSNLIALKDELLKLISTENVQEYNKLLHQTTLQASNMNYSKHSLSRSETYTNSIKTLNSNTINERLICIICYNNQRETLFRPCKHFAACIPCTKKYVKDNKNCPICREKINNLYEVKIPPHLQKSELKCLDCKSHRINVMLADCNHLCLCLNCARTRFNKKYNCPCCDKSIMRIISFILP